ncbi:MAG: HEAT repeat domain-containing protein [Nostoc sp. DedQUE05]|uniref:HEAT repeat domain-containing protein n=1 Tax=Nostoc sp. DedQUE05 TaxID=3075391 RepID=UPI002AD588C3|nr:HEAT repeat domain-containing protein [Nostoc sp. DedQUE05]MDZ8093947.1 HEAT repeat domain-containing protein [Nostoc sp. DedQUE05]
MELIFLTKILSILRGYKMLRNTVEKYLKLFKDSPNYRETDRIANEMRKEFDTSPPSVSEVIQELEKYASNPEDYPGASFVMMAAWRNLSKDYTPILCQILNDESNNGLHESVIELLDVLRDERAIPALSKALTYRWSYDEWLNVPRKSLLALAEIGTPEAKMIIESAAQSPQELISEDANLILDNW